VLQQQPINIPVVRIRQNNQKSMSTTKEEEIDLTDITRNNSQPTLISITKARREISRQLQARVCADPETKDHGQSYLVWEEADWLKKRQVTAPIAPPPPPPGSLQWNNA
jgi:hypothetical protein